MVSLDSWKYYKEVIVDHTKVDSSLTNFPVLVKLNSSNFDFSKSTGNDIRFTNADGNLSYEKESYINGEGIYWIKVPNISALSDTKFYMYYGNTTAQDESTSDIWSNGYTGVYHLNSLKDSSPKNNTLIANGVAAGNSEGVVGKCTYFNLNGGFTSINSVDSCYGNTVTVLAWFKHLSTTTYRNVVSNGHPWIGNGTGFDIRFGRDDSGTRLHVSIGTEYHNSVYSGSSIDVPSNNWYLGAYIFNGSQVRFYLNNVYKVSVNSSYINHPGKPIMIGNNDCDEKFDGWIDEVRLMNRAIDLNWLNTEYLSQTNQLLHFGTEKANTNTNTNALFFGLNF